MPPCLVSKEDFEKSMKNLRELATEITTLMEINRHSLYLTAFPQDLTIGLAILYVDEEVLVDCNLGGSSGNQIPSDVASRQHLLH